MYTLYIHTMTLNTPYSTYYDYHSYDQGIFYPVLEYGYFSAIYPAILPVPPHPLLPFLFPARGFPPRKRWFQVDVQPIGCCLVGLARTPPALVLWFVSSFCGP